MPMYDYHCPRCDIEFEKLVTVKDAANVDCPECGHGPAPRRLSMPAKPTQTRTTNCRGDGPPCGAPFCGRG
jgi:putative FmdB family regulatory protein